MPVGILVNETVFAYAISCHRIDDPRAVPAGRGHCARSSPVQSWPSLAWLRGGEASRLSRIVGDPVPGRPTWSCAPTQRDWRHDPAHLFHDTISGRRRCVWSTASGATPSSRCGAQPATPCRCGKFPYDRTSVRPRPRRRAQPRRRVPAWPIADLRSACCLPRWRRSRIAATTQAARAADISPPDRSAA